MLIKIEVNTELPVILYASLHLEGHEQVTDAICGECGLAKDTHNLNDRSTDFEVVFDDGHETVGDDCDVYLYPDGIFGLTPEPLDLEVLLNPLEEELHLPSVLVKQGDFLRAEEEIVGVIDETAMQLWRIIDDSSEGTTILLDVLLFGKADALIHEDVVFSVKQVTAINDFISWSAFFPDDEESADKVDAIEPGKVKIASVKHIASQRLVCEPIHRVDIMDFGIGDSVEHRNLRGDVNLGMNLDAGFGASEFSPSEHGHAQINGGGIDGIEPAVKFKLLDDALGLGDGDHLKSELLKNAVIPEHVGLREHLSVDWMSAKTEENGLLSMGRSKVCEFPEASAAHELAEHQHQHVAPMGERPAFGPVVVLGQDTPEPPLRKKLGYLRENVLSYVHSNSDFELGTKVRNSWFGQGVLKTSRCA